MLLTVDIGNTTVSYGLFNGRRLIRKGKLQTKENIYLKNLSVSTFNQIDCVIISSVVPVRLAKFKRELRKKFQRKVVVLGENVNVPIVNLYKKPSEVGQDRLVNAYAGYKIYGGGLIIIDYGTAVTFDVVSKKGEYLGGMIFPGLKISLEALCQRAALLPKTMSLRPTANLIGRRTKESISSGVYNGFASLTHGIVDLIKKEQGKKFKLIITGGDAKEIRRFLDNIDFFEPSLTLKGLMLVYESMFKTMKSLDNL